ncbi:MAG: response regulator transcription factor [Ignavibacteria bacterium]|nr:response regulator transcription factor [Ignavibacteria bacterium]
MISPLNSTSNGMKQLISLFAEIWRAGMKIFSAQVPENEQAEFNSIVLRDNMLRLQILIIPNIVFHLYLFSQDYMSLKNGDWLLAGNEGVAARAWFYLDLTMNIVSGAVLVISLFHRAKSHAIGKYKSAAIVYFYAIFVLLWSAVGSSVSQLEYGSISAYFLGVLSVSTALIFEPKKRLIIIMLGHCAFFTGIFMFQSNHVLIESHVQNTALLIVISWILSQILYVHTVRGFLDNKLIRRQADDIYRATVAEKERELEIQHIRAESERIAYEQTIKSQQRELEFSLRSLVSKNAFLSEIRAGLESVHSFVKPLGIERFEQIATRVRRSIASLDETEGLNQQFEEVHKNFMESLKHYYPTLTAMELKVAALLRMKLFSAGISEALFISKRTVEVHRLSIRKKMNLERNDDLYTILVEFDGKN